MSCEEWMDTRKLGHIPHVQHSETLLHTRNGEQSYFATHNASKPSRLQILRDTISQRKISLTKGVYNEILGRSKIKHISI